MKTAYSSSVIDLIRAQMVGAAGRGRRYCFTDALGQVISAPSLIETAIIVPHGGEPLDRRATASTYVADRMRP